MSEFIIFCGVIRAGPESMGRGVAFSFAQWAEVGRERGGSWSEGNAAVAAVAVRGGGVDMLGQCDGVHGGWVLHVEATFSMCGYANEGVG